MILPPHYITVETVRAADVYVIIISAAYIHSYAAGQPFVSVAAEEILQSIRHLCLLAAVNVIEMGSVIVNVDNIAAYDVKGGEYSVSAGDLFGIARAYIHLKDVSISVAGKKPAVLRELRIHDIFETAYLIFSAVRRKHPYIAVHFPVQISVLRCGKYRGNVIVICLIKIGENVPEYPCAVLGDVTELSGIGKHSSHLSAYIRKFGSRSQIPVGKFQLLLGVSALC